MSQDITQSFIEDYVRYGQNWKQDRLNRKMKVQDKTKWKFHLCELAMFIMFSVILIFYNSSVPSTDDTLNTLKIGLSIFFYLIYLFSSKKDDQFFRYLGSLKSADTFQQDYNTAVNEKGYINMQLNGSSTNGTVRTMTKIQRKLYPNKIKDWTGKFVDIVHKSQISIVTFYFHRKFSNKSSQDQYNRLLNQFKQQYHMGHNSYSLQSYQIQGFERFQVSYTKGSTGKILYVLLNIAWLLCLSWPFKFVLNLAVKQYQVTIDKELTFQK